MCTFKTKTPKELQNYINKINPDIPSKEICRERTLDCLRWYSRKAVFYKRFFFLLSIINIAAPLISTYLTSCWKDSLAGSVLAGLTTFSASMLALFNVREKWITYRSVAEYLKSQYTLYCAKSSPYNNDDADMIYLNNIEFYMTTVHAHWCDFHKPNSANASNTPSAASTGNPSQNP